MSVEATQGAPGPLVPGLVGIVSTRVGRADLASALGSGDVAVLGTPRVVALAEAAAIAAVQAALEVGATTVGTAVRMRHLAPTRPGAAVTATATLERVDGRSLAFRVEVRDDAGLVADGEHERAVVDRDRFIAKAEQRLSNLSS